MQTCSCAKQLGASSRLSPDDRPFAPVPSSGCSERASLQQGSKYIISNNHNGNRELEGTSLCHCINACGAVSSAAPVVPVSPSREGCSAAANGSESRKGIGQEDGRAPKQERLVT